VGPGFRALCKMFGFAAEEAGLLAGQNTFEAVQQSPDQASFKTLKTTQILQARRTSLCRKQGEDLCFSKKPSSSARTPIYVPT